MSLREYILRLESINLKAIYIFWSLLLLLRNFLIGVLVYLPSIAAIFIAGFIIFKSDYINVVFSKDAFVEAKKNLTIILSVSSGVFAFLTNASAAFARMPSEVADIDRFKKAAYSFLPATIALLTSLGIYFVYGNGYFKNFHVVDNNVRTILVNFFLVAMICFSLGMFHISSYYFLKLDRTFAAPVKENFSVISGDSIGIASIASLHWIVVWIYIGRVILQLYYSIVQLNILVIIGSIASIIISMNSYLWLEHGTWKSRALGALFLIFAIFTTHAMSH